MDAINLTKFVTTNILILNSTLGIENSFDQNCVFTIDYNFSISGSERIIQYLNSNKILTLNKYLTFVKIDSRELGENLFEVAISAKVSDDESNSCKFNVKSFVKSKNDHATILSYEIYNIKDDIEITNKKLQNNDFNTESIIKFCLNNFIECVIVADLKLQIYSLYQSEDNGNFSLIKNYNEAEELQNRIIPNLAKNYVNNYLIDLDFKNIENETKTIGSYTKSYQVYSENGTTGQVSNYYFKYNENKIIIILKDTTDQYNEILKLKYDLSK